jgi:hypothetical protein
MAGMCLFDWEAGIVDNRSIEVLLVASFIMPLGKKIG